MNALVYVLFQIISNNNQSKSRSNQYYPSFALHIEPSHLICIAIEMAGF